jgi:large subunit ribosomal protein L23
MKRGWARLEQKRSVSDERLYDIIRRPVVTEKSTSIGQYGQVVFEVAIDATKPEIKYAIETIYKVTVMDVNTLINKGKRTVFKGRRGQRSDRKKAIVTVREGQFIDVTAGV